MGSGTRLTSKQIAKVRKAYLETRSVQSVARSCALSRTTVRKYRKAGKWDEVIKEAQKQATEGMVNELAEKYAEDIKTINLAVHLMVEDLIAHHKAKQPIPWNPRSYRELVELRQALLGEPIGQAGPMELKLPDNLIVTIRKNEPRSASTKD